MNTSPYSAFSTRLIVLHSNGVPRNCYCFGKIVAMFSYWSSIFITLFIYIAATLHNCSAMPYATQQMAAMYHSALTVEWCIKLFWIFVLGSDARIVPKNGVRLYVSCRHYITFFIRLIRKIAHSTNSASLFYLVVLCLNIACDSRCCFFRCVKSVRIPESATHRMAAHEQMSEIESEEHGIHLFLRMLWQSHIHTFLLLNNIYWLPAYFESIRSHCILNRENNAE